MALAAYALTSATVLLLVFGVWQAVSWRTTVGEDRRAAGRSALGFGAAAVATGVGAAVLRLA